MEKQEGNALKQQVISTLEKYSNPKVVVLKIKEKDNHKAVVYFENISDVKKGKQNHLVLKKDEVMNFADIPDISATKADVERNHVFCFTQNIYINKIKNNGYTQSPCSSTRPGYSLSDSGDLDFEII